MGNWLPSSRAKNKLFAFTAFSIVATHLADYMSVLQSYSPVCFACTNFCLIGNLWQSGKNELSKKIDAKIQIKKKYCG